MAAPSKRHDGANNPGSQTSADQPEIERQGDFRGRYGYGRPAHKSDPNASYGFETNWLMSKRSN